MASTLAPQGAAGLALNAIIISRIVGAIGCLFAPRELARWQINRGKPATVMLGIVPWIQAGGSVAQP
jgi:hypothetical protein